MFVLSVFIGIDVYCLMTAVDVVCFPVWEGANVTPLTPPYNRAYINFCIMALAFLGNIASKVLPSVVGWGAKKIMDHSPLGGSVVQSIGEGLNKKTFNTFGLTRKEMKACAKKKMIKKQAKKPTA